jgi:hypothetical protein
MRPLPGVDSLPPLPPRATKKTAPKPEPMVEPTEFGTLLRDALAHADDHDHDAPKEAA